MTTPAPTAAPAHAPPRSPEQRIAELDARLGSMAQELASLRGRLASHESARGGFAKVLLVQAADTNGANWQQQWVSSNNTGLSPFVGGMSNAAAFIDPATATGGGTGVATLLQLRNGSNTAFLKIGGGATSIDVWDATPTQVATNAASLGISTSTGTPNVLKWVSGAVAGAKTPGAQLQVIPGGAARMYLQTGTTGAVVWDFPRFWS